MKPPSKARSTLRRWINKQRHEISDSETEKAVRNQLWYEEIPFDEITEYLRKHYKLRADRKIGVCMYPDCSRNVPSGMAWCDDHLSIFDREWGNKDRELFRRWFNSIRRERRQNGKRGIDVRTDTVSLHRIIHIPVRTMGTYPAFYHWQNELRKEAKRQAKRSGKPYKQVLRDKLLRMAIRYVQANYKGYSGLTLPRFYELPPEKQLELIRLYNQYISKERGGYYLTDLHYYMQELRERLRPK